MTTAATTGTRSAPLHGVRIVDLTTFLSGPFCTQVLADLGADVIKVEPFAGDSSRSIPPHFVGPDSVYFLGINRNKRSIAVDLKSEDGRRVLHDLILRSDVVVENFRPGVCKRLGLDVDQLRREKPDLVWTSISGYGQTGPWRDQPAYDMVVQALSGVMSLTGESGGAPVRVGVPIGDLVAGLYGVIGVLAGLAGRDRHTGGRTVDVAMLDSQLAMLSYQAAYSMHSGTVPTTQGRGHDSIPTYRAFTAGDDRDLVVTANTERMWAGLCRVLGLDHLLNDPRFPDGKMRLSNHKELWALLEKAFLAEDAATWVTRLTDRGVPAALIKTVPEALDDARQAGRDMIVDLESSDGSRRISVIGNPVRLVGEQPTAPQYPPALGEHTTEILAEILEMHPDEIRHLSENGSVLVGEVEREHGIQV